MASGNVSIDTQTYLDYLEATNNICFWDIESTGLKGDYGTVLVASVRPFNGDATTFRVQAIGNDQRLLRELGEYLDSFDCWVTYYGKGFDKPMVNTRLLRWNRDPLPAKHHIDLYYTLKANTVMSRRSMAQYAGLLDLHDQKMGVSPNVWTDILSAPRGQAMETMVERCESDTEVLKQLYQKTRHIIKEIKRG